jgi:hypothetical protein
MSKFPVLLGFDMTEFMACDGRGYQPLKTVDYS